MKLISCLGRTSDFSVIRPSSLSSLNYHTPSHEGASLYQVSTESFLPRCTVSVLVIRVSTPLPHSHALMRFIVLLLPSVVYS